VFNVQFLVKINPWGLTWGEFFTPLVSPHSRQRFTASFGPVLRTLMYLFVNDICIKKNFFKDANIIYKQIHQTMSPTPKLA
jgi:hypothetical protein